MAPLSAIGVIESALTPAARMDEFEKFIASCPPLKTGDFVVDHRFVRTYIRTARMKKGTIYATKEHNSRHPFDLSEGRIIAYTPGEGWQRLAAPYSGITEPGTRRLIFIEEDAVFSTYHETDKTDILEIEKDIIKPHDNPLLTDEEKKRLIPAIQ